MKIFRSLESAAAGRLVRPATTLGVFDGVHVGHQEVLRQVTELARATRGDSVVVTFGRHPRAIIEGRAPKLITALRHKLRIFQDLGVKATLLLHFDRALREMPAREFVERVFVDALHARSVTLGYNNRFGKGGEGGIDLLRKLGSQHAFDAFQVGEVRLGGQPLSSTAIRQAILNGDLEGVECMLGRPFSVLGRVVRGDRVGTQLGFPTANLNVHHEVRPPRGVYGCEVRMSGESHFGVVNIGVRPTVDEKAPANGEIPTWKARDRLERIEVHVLDFEGDLYGRNVEVVFLQRIRGETRFDSLEALADQIGRDCQAFRKWLLERPQQH